MHLIALSAVLMGWRFILSEVFLHYKTEQVKQDYMFSKLEMATKQKPPITLNQFI